MINNLLLGVKIAVVKRKMVRTKRKEKRKEKRERKVLLKGWPRLNTLSIITAGQNT